jgi:hypothetical protein
MRYRARRYAEAADLWTASIALRDDPEIHEALLHAHRLQGDDAGAAREALRAMTAAGVPPEVIAGMARRPPSEIVRDYLRGAIALLGRTPPAASPERMAVLYASLGDREASLAWIEKASGERSPGLAGSLRDPALDGLRGDPRFERVRRRVGGVS